MNRRKVLARVKLAVDHGFSATRVSYLASGDPLFVKKLRNGHAFRPATLLRAYKTICEFDRPRYAQVALGKRRVKAKAKPPRKRARFDDLTI